ncbi:MAG: hypothetical protein E7813_16000 [Bradyrhizobium sp.]|uniref:hypothetical protein n=1 Tax=Bradyrhizobium sp. TaxID=376 RepID=UPI00122AC232|nr:hypothetical protein [Bradyrhizobium sp.]THD65085.1 MAG: hypothetical protein E7813_16000 [Bradyrhizobium sp.]
MLNDFQSHVRGGTLGSKNKVMQLGLSIAVVGAVDGKGRGKMTYDYFLPPFERTLAALDCKVRHYSYGEFIFSRHRDDAAILLYSEVRSQKNPAFLQTIEDAEVAARARNTLLVNAPAIGRLIADKSSTNGVLAAGGIDVPVRVPTATLHAPFKVFSNENIGSSAPVQVLDPGAPLDASRYNTEWIDTRHDHNGRLYYVSLRVMAAGSQCVSVWVRMRPVEDGNPAVHNTDTTLDASLWNSLYRRIVVPQLGAIQNLCEKIANVLGLGFFSHDILPEQHSSRLLVCETGFKFDAGAYRPHLMPLFRQLIVNDFLSDSLPKRSAECFVNELVKHLNKARQERR